MYCVCVLLLGTYVLCVLPLGTYVLCVCVTFRYIILCMLLLSSCYHHFVTLCLIAFIFACRKQTFVI